MWNEHHDRVLAECFGKGMTGLETAAELNRRFGTSYSRNAVIGRALRQSIKSINPPVGPGRVGKLNLPKPWEEKGIHKRTYYRQKAKALAAPRQKPRQQQFSRDESGLRQADVVPLNLSLVGLESHNCRWPYGDGPFVFCGCPAFEGGPYCEPHTALATRPFEVRPLGKRAPPDAVTPTIAVRRKAA